MANYSRQLLSSSTGGQVIPIAATSTPGTTLHVAVAGTSAFDEVYLWVSNVTGSAATLTIAWGSVTDPGGLITKNLVIPANSPPIPVVPGIVLNNGVSITAWSGTASALNVSGYVNRIQ